MMLPLIYLTGNPIFNLVLLSNVGQILNTVLHKFVKKKKLSVPIVLKN